MLKGLGPGPALIHSSHITVYLVICVEHPPGKCNFVMTESIRTVDHRIGTSQLVVNHNDYSIMVDLFSVKW